MNNGTVIILYVLLTLNTLRYGTYILEGNSSTYYIAMFSLNILALLSTIIYRNIISKKKTEANITE